VTSSGLNQPTRSFAPPGLTKYWQGIGFLSSDWIALNRVGDEGNSEAQYYRPGNIALNSSSQLEITSQVESFGGKSYTSGMLQWASYNFTFGTIKVRAKMPGGTGPWPAIWLLGNNCETTNITTADNTPPCSWPDPGSDEIDFVEFLNGDFTHANQQTHMTSGSSGGSVALGFDASAAFHIYEMTWAANSIIWKVDGTQTSSISTNVPNTPKFLIMDVALGGIGGGTINNSTLPQKMTVDWVSLTT
jgi:beta-glucanase (GH16 family)